MNNLQGYIYNEKEDRYYKDNRKSFNETRYDSNNKVILFEDKLLKVNKTKFHSTLLIDRYIAEYKTHVGDLQEDSKKFYEEGRQNNSKSSSILSITDPTKQEFIQSLKRKITLRKDAVFLSIKKSISKIFHPTKNNPDITDERAAKLNETKTSINSKQIEAKSTYKILYYRQLNWYDDGEEILLENKAEVQPLAVLNRKMKIALGILTLDTMRSSQIEEECYIRIFFDENNIKSHEYDNFYLMTVDQNVYCVIHSDMCGIWRLLDMGEECFTSRCYDRYILCVHRNEKDVYLYDYIFNEYVFVKKHSSTVLYCDMSYPYVFIIDSKCIMTIYYVDYNPIQRLSERHIDYRHEDIKGLDAYSYGNYYGRSVYHLPIENGSSFIYNLTGVQGMVYFENVNKIGEIFGVNWNIERVTRVVYDRIRVKKKDKVIKLRNFKKYFHTIYHFRDKFFVSKNDIRKIGGIYVMIHKNLNLLISHE